MRWGHPKDELLSRHVDKALLFKEQVKLEQHLGGCSDCEMRLAAFGRVREVLKALPPLVDTPFPEPAVPTFIPVIKPVVSWKAITAGLAVGVVLTVGIVTWRSIQSPIRVISSATAAVGPQGILQGKLRPGESVQTLAPGYVDLELPNNVLLRLQPGTTMTWQQVRQPLLFASRQKVIVNIMRGEILARTQEGFWGANLEVRTPSAHATVKGTAFSMRVDPGQDQTTLKVLAGTVFFSPLYLTQVGVEVQGGEISHIRGARRLPKLPKPLSSEERKALLEVYSIGGNSQLAELVIGAGPERLKELLKPALLYLSDQSDFLLQPLFRKYVERLNASLLNGKMIGRKRNLQILEQGLKTLPNPELEVPLRLYVGAYYAHMDFPHRAQFHFQRIIERVPDHPLASLALAAIAQVAQKQLQDEALARESFQQLLAQYPNSPEAALAKQFLKSASSR